MRLLRSCCAILLAGLGVGRAALAPPAEWKLPPVDGELSGQFSAAILGVVPKLKWKLKLATPRPRERTVEFSVEGTKFHLNGDAQVDPMGEGTWRIAEAEIDIGEWFALFAPQFEKEIGSASLSGTLSLNAGGTWRGGQLGGRATINLRNGRIDDPKHKVSLEGIELSLVVDDIAKRHTAPAQFIAWASGHYDQIQLGAGRIDFSVADDTVNITRAAVGLFGGQLSVTGISFSRTLPKFTASAQVSGFELAELARLVPKIIASAKGEVDGYIELTHDESGFDLGSGFLGLREGAPAELRLVPTPGILSSVLPPSIKKVYSGIAKVEQEGLPLLAEVLQMRFVPDHDEQDRTAWLHVAGRPVDPGFKGPIDLTINVHGPLDELINIGANSAMRMMGKR